MKEQKLAIIGAITALSQMEVGEDSDISELFIDNLVNDLSLALSYTKTGDLVLDPDLVLDKVM